MYNAQGEMINDPDCGRIALPWEKEDRNHNMISFQPVVARNILDVFIAAGKPLPQDAVP
jgi:hypothetical protein